MIDRADALSALSEEQFDVVVVGGGITGAGVALDASTRGYSVALVERADFAAAIDVFTHYYRQVEDGITGFIAEDSISPLENPELLSDVDISDDDATAALMLDALSGAPAALAWYTTGTTLLGIPATILMPHDAPAATLAATFWLPSAAACR